MPDLIAATGRGLPVALTWMLLVVGAGLESAAEAQGAAVSAPDAEASMSLARDLFLQGREAADEGRWADAYRLLQESYEVSGQRSPQALYNAAMALRALGRHLEARDALQELIDRHGDSEEVVALARARRDEEADRVATLRLVDLDLGVRYDVRLDGRGVTLEGDGSMRELETNPGARTLSVERDGYRPFSWEGRVVDGQRLEIPIVLEEIEERPSVARNPWLWTALAVVLAGAGVGLYFVLDGEAQVPTRDLWVVEL